MELTAGPEIVTSATFRQALLYIHSLPSDHSTVDLEGKLREAALAIGKPCATSANPALCALGRRQAGDVGAVGPSVDGDEVNPYVSVVLKSAPNSP